MMKKLAFVIPWYGENIPGGAEMELRGMTQALMKRGVELEILTTCVKEFSADWNVNYYKEGRDIVQGVVVRRFKVTPKKRVRFAEINARLMKGFPITLNEEDIFLEEMVNSDALYRYIEDNKDKYRLFIYIPYMFGTTYHGARICPEKTVLIPCFHKEAYIYMHRFKELYSQVAGMIFNAKPEEDLASKVFDLSVVNTLTLGIGMDTDICGDKQRFRTEFNIKYPYILYAGRKDIGKNIHILIKYFGFYKRRIKGNLKLILIGGGNIEIPEDLKNEIIDLGFVETQQKYDAYSGALLLCQPSINESFSLVIMESWLCGRPVLVHEFCDVTKNFVEEAEAGLYFKNYLEFESCINYIKEKEDIAIQMGKNGKAYVKENFEWSIIMDKFMNYIEKLVLDKER